MKSNKPDKNPGLLSVVIVATSATSAVTSTRRSQHCSKCVMSITSCNPQDNPVREALLLFLCDRWENWSSERLSDFPKGHMAVNW